MPRMQQQVITRPSIAPELRALYAQLLEGEQTAFERAMDIGEKLLTLPTTADQKAACKAAGINKEWRTVLEWMQVARHRDLVTRNSAQSINQALKVIRAAEGSTKDGQAPEDELTEPLYEYHKLLPLDQPGCGFKKHITVDGWCLDDRIRVRAPKSQRTYDDDDLTELPVVFRMQMTPEEYDWFMSPVKVIERRPRGSDERGLMPGEVGLTTRSESGKERIERWQKQVQANQVLVLTDLQDVYRFLKWWDDWRPIIPYV